MLWVYGLNLPRDAAFDAIAEPVNQWDENDEHVPWPFGVAVGTDYLDHDTVEPAFIDDLGTPLSDHLIAMTRADASLFVADKDRLDAVRGMVIMISRSPTDSDLSRTPDAPYMFLGTYPQEPYSFSLGSMPDGPAPLANPAPLHQNPVNIKTRNILTAALVVGIVALVVIFTQLIR